MHASSWKRPLSLVMAAAVVLAPLGLALPAEATPGPTTLLTNDAAQVTGVVNAALNGDGSVVAFTATDPGLRQNAPNHWGFVWHRDTGALEPVDYLPDGSPSNPTGYYFQFTAPVVSANGRYVAYVGFRLEGGHGPDACTSPNDDELHVCREIYRRDLQTDDTKLVSVARNGGFADGDSMWPSISADGNRIAFGSSANNLVDGDTRTTGGSRDVFVRDMSAGTTEMVDVSTAGAQADDYSDGAAISGDGQHVAFVSGATNLGGDPSPHVDAFVRDLATNRTSPLLASGAATRGQDLPTLDYDGQVAAFITYESLLASDTDDRSDLYVADRGTGNLTTPSWPGTGYPESPVLSRDGRLLSFTTDLGDGMWVFDRTTGTTERESVRSDGSSVRNLAAGYGGYTAGMSGDGRFVVFISRASDVVGNQRPTPSSARLYVHDRGAPQDTAAGTDGATTDQGGSGPSLTDSIETTVSGGHGAVSIKELGADDPANGDLSGYDLFGQQVQITAASTTPPDYMTFTFEVDRSVAAGYGNPFLAQVLRNGAPLDRCADADDPGPCVAERTVMDSGDWRFVVHTPDASVWAVAVPNGRPTGTGDADPPQVDVSSPADGATYAPGESVSAQYSCDDTGSGVEQCSGSQPNGSTIDTSAPGAHAFSVYAEDAYGNHVTKTVHYTVGSADHDAPTISIVRPALGAKYKLGQRVLASYSCSDPDSGVASCVGTRASGAALDTDSVGTKTFTVTARDNAGNSASKSVSYHVLWPLTGFSAPVDNPPVLNTAKAGAIIPMKFSLGGNRGTSIFAAGYPRVDTLGCPRGAKADEIETTLKGSPPTLSYSNGVYTYALRTQSAWRSSTTCRGVTLRFKDGQQLTAGFKLR